MFNIKRICHVFIVKWIYHVFRIGSGGSTLHILQLLADQHGDDLDTWRTLIIHAGNSFEELK